MLSFSGSLGGAMDELTPVANKVNLSAVSSNAQGMVLHARTSANVTKD